MSTPTELKTDREQFEAWIAKFGYDGIAMKRTTDGYAGVFPSRMWAAWQACAAFHRQQVAGDEEIAALRAELKPWQDLKLCPECKLGFLTQCGEQDSDGEPSMDCRICRLRAELEKAEVKPSAEWKPKFAVGQRVNVPSSGFYGVYIKSIVCERTYEMEGGARFDESLIELPLPSTAKELVALEAEVSHGSFLRHSDGKAWASIICFNQTEVIAILPFTGLYPKAYSLDELREMGYEILRPGSTEWKTCSKPKETA